MSKRKRQEEEKYITIGRFYDKIIPPFNKSKCWIWREVPTSGGYGIFSLNGKSIPAHRLSWILHFGEIPTGIEILHSCDTRLCVNPYHLFQGTQGDNVRDCTKKKRNGKSRGEDHPFSKLKDEQIALVVKRGQNGEKYKNIAADLGISTISVGDILRGNSWKHLTGGVVVRRQRPRTTPEQFSLARGIFQKTGNISEACRVTNINRGSFYYWLERS